MKDIGKILAYFAAVILLGALLAPPLYWLGQTVASHGVMQFLAETDFQKFFNRGMLIAAIVLIWPAVKWLRIGSVRELGLEQDKRRWNRFAAGFLIGGLVVAVLAAAYIGADVYRWKKVLAWDKLPPLLLSALVVGLLEESLFRGAILGLFRRSLSPWAAVLANGLVFSAVHFLKPDDSVEITKVDWLAGFDLVPHVFHQFSEPTLLLAHFITLLVLGLMLADVTIRTRSLWLAIGLHAGLVFVKMSFSKFTKREEVHLPWIGERLEVGLVPVAAMLLMWLAARLWLRYVDPRSTSANH